MAPAVIVAVSKISAGIVVTNRKGDCVHGMRAELGECGLGQDVFSIQCDKEGVAGELGDEGGGQRRLGNSQ